MPKISVVMAVYNGEKFIREAIESVLNQTEKDFEFIIVDDGSTDKSADIIKSFSDPRIQYEKRLHRGLIESLNHGLFISKGAYIARMDADDRSMPMRFEKQLARFLADENLAVCGSWASVIDDEGASRGELSYPKIFEEEIKKYALLHNPFIHPSVMIKKSVLREVGFYRNFWKNIEDYELWTRIVFKYETANIGENLLEYRAHKNQVTNKKKNEIRLRGVLVRILAIYRYLRELSKPLVINLWS